MSAAANHGQQAMNTRAPETTWSYPLKKRRGRSRRDDLDGHRGAAQDRHYERITHRKHQRKNGIPDCWAHNMAPNALLPTKDETIF